MRSRAFCSGRRLLLVAALAAAAGCATKGGGAPAQGATATAASYTMTQVAERNTREACWTVVEREVYDVTDWIARHPGGQARIEGLCGTDGSARFSG